MRRSCGGKALAIQHNRYSAKIRNASRGLTPSGPEGSDSGTIRAMPDNEDLSIRQLLIGQMANFVYIVGSKSTGEAAVIDPGWDAERILNAASTDGLRIKTILVTHSHFDHTNAARELSQRTAAPIYANRHEAPLLGRLGVDVIEVEDEAELDLGEQRLKCLHTPGHTPGSHCILVDRYLFTGDTLFVKAIGRSDLPGSSPEQLFESLSRLKGLPAETVVLPGHHYGDRPASTIGEECRTNPYLRSGSVQDFLRIMGR
jgi:hydroxyacylglutathione hydrolase